MSDLEEWSDLCSGFYILLAHRLSECLGDRRWMEVAAAGTDSGPHESPEWILGEMRRLEGDHASGPFETDLRKVQALVEAWGAVSSPEDVRGEPHVRLRDAVVALRDDCDRRAMAYVAIMNLDSGAPEVAYSLEAQGEPEHVHGDDGIEGEDRTVPVVNTLLQAVVEVGASSLHLASGHPPIVRKLGSLEPMQNFAILGQADIESLVFPLLSTEERAHLEIAHSVSLFYSLSMGESFHINLLRQQDALNAVFHHLQSPTIEDLRLPSVVRDVCSRSSGLVLVSGPARSGRSSTVAAMIDFVNRNALRHIVTVEDIVEYRHRGERSIVQQLVIGEDVASYAEARGLVLREDPDVVVVGSMLDLEAMELAIGAALAGCLVVGALQASSSAESIDTLIRSFPKERQEQIRLSVASTLAAVFWQTALPRSDGHGRVVAMEVLLGVPVVRKMIEKAETYKLGSFLAQHAGLGMQSLNASLVDLVRQKLITSEVALGASDDVDLLKMRLGLPG